MSCYKLILSLLISWSSVLPNVNCETIICELSETECNCNAAIDSPEPCSLHCNNTDVCKGKTLNCRPGDPCTVLCQGYASCTDTTIQPNTATDVSITCDGTDACKDVTATCGSGDCTVQCDDSCMELLSINTTFANSFACSGNCGSEIIPPPFSAPLPTTSPTPFPTTIPTMTPSLLPTWTPTSNPSAKASTLHPISVRPSNPTVAPTERRIVDQKVATVASYLSTQSPLDEDVEIRYIQLHPQFTSLCYVVIAVSATIVICVCVIACGLVYVHHKHTQQLLVAATQSYKANMNGTTAVKDPKYEHRFQTPPPPSLNHFQTPSFMMNPPSINPYKIPAIEAIMNAIPYTPQNMTPNMNALTPNLTALNRTVSAISVNNDAMSHCDREGTETHTHRKMSDMPALPHLFGPMGDTSAQTHDTALPYKHKRQRASIHMTPAGYLDEEFITTKRKKTTEDIMPGRMPFANHSNANSTIHSPVQMDDTNHHIALEVLRLGEEAKLSGSVGITVYDEQQDADVDDIHIPPDDSKKPEPQSLETVSNTEDLSRELFATQSESHSRNVSHDVVPPDRSPWYQYHQVGSLPVIISCNNVTQPKQPPLDRARAQSAVLTIKHREEEPLQLPLLLNNNLIPPTDHTESTYNSDGSESYDAAPGEMDCEESYDDDLDSDCGGEEEYPSRITKTSFIDHSDTDPLGDDDAYFEVKPLVESSTIVQTECDSNSTSMLSSCGMEEDKSETSVKECSVNDSIILEHAYKLMHLVSHDSTYQGRRSSVSFGV